MRSAFKVGFLALASLVLAEDDSNVHKVDVGNGGLKFDPSSITAATGDVVEFHFYPQKHSVVQGSFDKPCQVGSATTGFNSGFFPVSKGEGTTVFRVTVNSTDPMYFYCSQVSHCQNGMVGAINPPSSGNTLEAYSSAAAQTSDSETPANVQGGVVAANSEDSESSSSSVASAATSAASSASSEATSAASSESSVATGAASSAASAATSAAASVTSAAGSATSAATSAKATVTGNSAAGLGRVSFEMLGLAGLAGGVAVMMQ